jgi:hypothetical protein
MDGNRKSGIPAAAAPAQARARNTARIRAMFSSFFSLYTQQNGIWFQSRTCETGEISLFKLSLRPI